ncbi:MAG: helix-turn-helix transcriptional regulator [Chlamydiota bacterium]
MEKYGESDSIPWEDLTKDRIAKYKKSGLALRGARYRESISQKELAKRTGINQENISRMENGKRATGEQVAKKLAKVLRINFELLTNNGQK